MIIVITGPTGVGKTKLSVELAKKYDAEIVNGDSVQIYKDLNIGSAKVTEEEKEGIVHHMFDIKKVTEEYSLFDYQKDARQVIDEILSRGKNVIIVGGTGLYIKSALFQYELSDEEENNQYEDKTTEELYQELINLDKDIQIDKHNRRRIVRALNYYKTNHKSISLNNKGNKLIYNNVTFIGLTVNNRTILYERINKRVDKMIAMGLINEVKSFYDKGINARILNSAIGYKELYSYFKGNISYEESVELIKRNSRRYAKRQYTFFNHQFNIKWFNVDFDDFNKTVTEVANYIDMKKE